MPLSRGEEVAVSGPTVLSGASLQEGPEELFAHLKIIKYLRTPRYRILAA